MLEQAAWAVLGGPRHNISRRSAALGDRSPDDEFDRDGLSDGQREETMPATDCEAMVAKFIRTKGITRCPTACVLPTQGLFGVSDAR